MDRALLRQDAVSFPRLRHRVRAGGGLTLTGSKSPFQRTVSRSARRPAAPQGRLQLRTEAGRCWRRSDAQVPSTQLFRTGGDTTVRGYGIRDIGVELPDGVIAPGRYMVIGSAEWQRPIRSKGVETKWESALFVDGGAVSNSVSELRPVFGAGVGARWKSPWVRCRSIWPTASSQGRTLAHEHRGDLRARLSFAARRAFHPGRRGGGVAGRWQPGCRWWTGTEGSAAWTLQQLARYQPVTAEGVQGASRSGLRARRLSWEAEGLKVEATDVQLAGNCLRCSRLLRARPRARGCAADRDRPPKPKLMPGRWRSHRGRKVDEVKAGQAQWVSAATHRSFGGNR